MELVKANSFSLFMLESPAPTPAPTPVHAPQVGVYFKEFLWKIGTKSCPDFHENFIYTGY